MTKEEAARDLKKYILSNCLIGYGDFTVWPNSNYIEVIFRYKQPQYLKILPIWKNYPVTIRENVGDEYE